MTEHSAARPPIPRARHFPTWARLVAGSFTFMAALGWIALGLFALLMHDLAIEPQVGFAVLPLVIGAGIAAGGALAFEVARDQALFGFHTETRVFARLTEGAVAILLAGLLFLVHPLLAVGIVVGAAVNLLGLVRLRRVSKAWLPAPGELGALLAGRDAVGLARAAGPPAEDGDRAGRSGLGAGIVTTLGTGGWLGAHDTLSIGGYVALVVLTIWALGAIGRATPVAVDAWGGRHARNAPAPFRDTAAPRLIADDEYEGDDLAAPGLLVHRLNLRDTRDRALLADLSFEVAPGAGLHLQGPSGGGKSLLLRAIADPGGIADAAVQGHLRLGGAALWPGGPGHAPLDCVMIGRDPALLPVSAIDNLGGFGDGMRARNILELLQVFGPALERIINAADATRLTPGERRLLALSRGLMIRPRLLLLDRPETDLDARQIGALAQALHAELHAGRSLILVTDSRPLAELCSHAAILADGRIADIGAREEIAARQNGGHARLELDRDDGAEDRLHSWIRSQFKRAGDERNRRNAGLAATELLALAGGPITQRLRFEFTHQRGSCRIAMYDGAQALSPVMLAAAREAGDTANAPISALLRRVQSLDQMIDGLPDGFARQLEIAVETYDPRECTVEAAHRTQTEDAPG